MNDLPKNEPIKHNPTSKELRLFGLLFAGVIVFWLFIYRVSTDTAIIRLWPGFAIASSLAAIAVIRPLWLTGLFVYWIKVVHWLNRLITAITLTCCFFVIITPVALIRRILGHNAIFKPKYRPDSYRQNSKAIRPQDMEHPF